MNKRTTQILEILTESGKAEVSELARLLNVSEVTMRKDLTELEHSKLIVREHGFASLRSRNDIASRLAYHYEEKRKIAEKAAELIKDGDTLMIESGSCCALLADVLAATKKDLTIITNSAFIANYIRDKAAFEIVLLGGIYQKDSQVNVGPLISTCASNYFVRYFFIGTDGYSEKTGFTNHDQMRAQAVRDMSSQCEELVIVTESTKFNKRGIVPLNIKNQPKLVITDSNVDQEMIAHLNASDINVITAK